MASFSYKEFVGKKNKTTTHTHTHRIWDYRQDVVARTTKFAPFNIASSSTMSFRKGNFTKWLRNCLRRACPCTLTDVLPLPLFLVGGAFPDFHSSLMMRYFVVMPLFLYIFWFFFSLTIFQQQKIVIFLKTFEISLKCWVPHNMTRIREVLPFVKRDENYSENNVTHTNNPPAWSRARPRAHGDGGGWLLGIYEIFHFWCALFCNIILLFWCAPEVDW